MRRTMAGRILAALVMMGLLAGVAGAQEDILSRIPSDSTMVIIFRDGVSLDKKIERVAIQIMPMQPGNPQLQMITQMLQNIAQLDAAKLKADAPIALVMKLAADVSDEPHGMLL